MFPALFGRPNEFGGNTKTPTTGSLIKLILNNKVLISLKSN